MSNSITARGTPTNLDWANSSADAPCSINNLITLPLIYWLVFTSRYFSATSGEILALANSSISFAYNHEGYAFATSGVIPAIFNDAISFPYSRVPALYCWDSS